MKKFSFTLIEIVMVVALLAVLAGIAIGGYSYANNSARESATRAVIKQIEAALESGKVKHGFYSTALGTGNHIQLLDTGGADIADNALNIRWGNVPERYVKDFRKMLDLESLRQYIDADGELCDAWGNKLLYTSPDTANHKAFTVRSIGPDNTANNADDITN